MRKHHFSLLIAMSALLTICSNLRADVVDFTDGNFASHTTSPNTLDPVIFSETVLGAMITFESTLNFVGEERFIGMQDGVASNGLRMGGGAGTTIEFTMSSNIDILFDSYSTDSTSTFLGNATLDVLDGNGSLVSAGNSLAQGNPMNLLAGGPILLNAGEVYTLDVENTGAAVISYVPSFSFSAVPEPGSGCVLLLSALASGLRRRRRN